MGNLVISRRDNESVIIETEHGEKIKITVCKISGNQVRLSCNADKSITIHREEIYDRLLQERAA